MLAAGEIWRSPGLDKKCIFSFFYKLSWSGGMLEQVRDYIVHLCISNIHISKLLFQLSALNFETYRPGS